MVINFKDTLYSTGLYLLILRPTRITSHSVTLIDNIFTNQLNADMTSSFTVEDIIDYLMMFTLYNLINIVNI